MSVKKRDLYILKDKNGEVISSPDDWFMDEGVCLRQWLLEEYEDCSPGSGPKLLEVSDLVSNSMSDLTNNKWLEKSLSSLNKLKSKIEIFQSALLIAGKYDKDFLDYINYKEPPRVIKNYFSDCLPSQIIFIFKLRNNGTTVRIVDDHGQFQALVEFW